MAVLGARPAGLEMCFPLLAAPGRALWAVPGETDVHTPMLTCGASTSLTRR